MIIYQILLNFFFFLELLSDNIRPIQFVGNRYNTYADKTGMVIGWGKDGPTGTGTKRLKYAAVPIISNYECSMYWPVTEAHVCTSAAYDEDACQVNQGSLFLYIFGTLLLEKEKIKIALISCLMLLYRETAVVH